MAAISIPLMTEEAAPHTELREPPEGHIEVLGAIYLAHYSYVLRVCQRFFRQREDAEDAASEVFLKLHKIEQKRDPNVPFRPWISRVAGRHCIDMLRHRKSEKNSCITGVDVSRVPDRVTPSPLSQIQNRQERRLLRQQLMRLPEHYMVPLLLHYYKQMSYTAIGEKLNKGLPAVKLIMYRAKHQLRRKVGESGTAKSCRP